MEGLDINITQQIVIRRREALYIGLTSNHHWILHILQTSKSLNNSGRKLPEISGTNLKKVMKNLKS